MRTFKLIVGLLFFTFVTACSTQPNANPGYTVITPATLKPNDPIPPPTGTIVLSLTGKIGTTNAPNRLDFDMETLEKLGLVEFKVNDPYLKRSAVYQGVLLQRLLEVARIPADATTLHTVALNDYATDVPIKPLAQWPVMLATKLDGQRMPIADKGPIEIVFPYDTFTIDANTYDPMWVWQLRSIEVR